MPWKDSHSIAARESKAARMRRWRAKHLVGAGTRTFPFSGVDGEGAGVDSQGRQLYRLLRAGDAELYDRGRPLSSLECLDFLAELPKDVLWVGYYFDYDATQILRDLPEERLARLFAPRPVYDRWIDWAGFQLDYLPRKYLRVRRKGMKKWTVVSDVGSFFQCTFVTAIERWNVGTASERAIVSQGKKRRGKVATIDAKERRYNALEVRLLAELMERFRNACLEVGYLPRAYRGPGYLASAMMERKSVPRRRDLAFLPSELWDFADRAYVGGRFEVMRVGRVKGPVWGHDINSAYPHALLSLPCLRHGRWEHGRGKPRGDPWIARVAFRHRGAARHYVCGLPVRLESGSIVWPEQAEGIYFGGEVQAAIDSGATVQFLEWWGYRRDCDCRPFDWVPELYEERRRLGKDGRGLVLKLALNSVYGKLAQRVGAAPWGNPIWAGMITSHTRSAIMRACRGREKDVLMVATDGIVTRSAPLPVEQGLGLGQWTVEKYPGIFIVQPGFYWLTDGVLKTRGTRRANVEPLRARFQKAWARMYRRRDLAFVRVPETLFIGLRLALARGKLETAGCWISHERLISFDWTTKRAERVDHRNGAIQTYTQRGSASLVSRAYDRIAPEVRRLDLERMEHESQPDFDLGNDR